MKLQLTDPADNINKEHQVFTVDQAIAILEDIADLRGTYPMQIRFILWDDHGNDISEQVVTKFDLA